MIGGPVGDTGLTGRKIIVDTYGGFARHGGGAFSGKDPSKVDRSAAYAARYVAKNIVAAGLADRAEVQVAYAIGVARPLSLLIETFGTEKISRKAIAELVQENFDLRPGAILRDLDLRRPVYQPTAAYGHFGRTGDGFTWERTDKADQLRTQAGLLSQRLSIAADASRVLRAGHALCIANSRARNSRTITIANTRHAVIGTVRECPNGTQVGQTGVQTCSGDW